MTHTESTMRHARGGACVDPHRRALLAAGIAFASASGTAFATAQPWPQKPIRIVVPVSAGGVVDLAARLLAPRLSQSLGQSVIVENRPGADTTLGVNSVATSPGDGYTWLLVPSSSITQVPLLKKVDYDPVRSFVPAAFVGHVSQAFVLPASLGVKSLAQFVALARSKPGALNYAHAGSGTVGQLNTFLLERAAGIEMQPVAYKGGAAALADLMTNRVSFAMLPTASVAPAIVSGKLQAVAVVGKGRSAMLPETPTAAEAGYSSVNLVGWLGLLMPAGTPPAVVQRAHAAVASALADQAVSEGLKLMDVTIEPAVTASAFAAQIRQEVAAMPALFKAARIEAER